GNASTGLGIELYDRKYSSYDLLIEEKNINQILIQTAIPNLSIIPSTMDLLGIEMILGGEKDRLFRLDKALSVQLTSDFSYIFLDCPPSFNLLTMNAMAAADSILVPLQCEFFALEGLSQLLETVEEVRRTVNSALDIQGIILTMFDS
ncbi:chromosome partitioning protein ParA, partial [Candidatus Liberibacter asiaticus]